MLWGHWAMWLKRTAGSELLAAVAAVLEGRQFVSRGLSGHSFAHATDEQATEPCHEEFIPSLVPRKAEITRSHEVEFYSDDAAFVVGFTRFIEASLKAGNAVIVVATEAHRKDLLASLQAHGVDIVAAIEQGRYISLDAADALSAFMVNGEPDPARFQKVVGNLVAAAAKASKGERPRVAVLVVNVPLPCMRKGGRMRRSSRTPLGRDRQELQRRYSVRVCVEQLSS